MRGTRARICTCSYIYTYMHACIHTCIVSVWAVVILMCLDERYACTIACVLLYMYMYVHVYVPIHSCKRTNFNNTDCSVGHMRITLYIHTYMSRHKLNVFNLNMRNLNRLFRGTYADEIVHTYIHVSS